MENSHIIEDLSKAYNILAMLGLDDLIYTHLSARSNQKNSFYVSPFGLCFDEVTPQKLLEVSLDGEFAQNENDLNDTIHVVHRSVYANRSDIQYIFHIHTPSITAVSSTKQGLIPATQWALHFYNNLSYHDYNALALESSYTNTHSLAQDLGMNFVMLMRNHGALICGRTVQEAMHYTYHLEQACKAQCLIGNQETQTIVPNHEICEQTFKDVEKLKPQTMKKTWDALLRKLKKES